MTQTMLFLTKYAGELSVLLCSLVVVLLFVILHRMKRITKLIQEITGNTNDGKPVMVGQEGKKENHPVVINKSRDGLEAANKELVTAENAELLSEVLEEIFP